MTKKLPVHAMTNTICCRVRNTINSVGKANGKLLELFVEDEVASGVKLKDMLTIKSFILPTKKNEMH